MSNTNPPANGFDKRPQDINRKGQPKKYLTELLEKIGAEVEEKTGKTYQELISRRAWEDALAGDQRAIEFIFDRIEGKPQQSMALSGEVSLPQPIYGNKSRGTV